VARLRQHDILVGANLRLPFEAGYVRVAVGPVSQMRRFIEVLRTILRDRRSARRHRRERK
jgi:histidinol-phosphate/aromatic aminotransferase/cobyric acid decarboxylase-like protein